MPPHLFRHRGVGIGIFAKREELALAEKTLAARNWKRDNDPVAWAQIFHLATHIDHLTHELVADDIALIHGRNEPVIEMKIRPADGGGGNLHDGIAWIENFG